MIEAHFGDLSKGFEGFALYSDDKVYRYALWRRWRKSTRIACWILLNPSTATEAVDDPTVARCGVRSRRMEMDGYIVVNLFAFRATDPKVMRAAKDPIGPDNDHAILQACHDSTMVICGWGTHGTYLERGNHVRELLRRHNVEPYHLGLTRQTWQPLHPLYLPYDKELEPWT